MVMADEDIRHPATQPQRVVVGVEDGPTSDAALAFGYELARALQVPLHAVHVYAEHHAGPESPLLRFGDPKLVAHEVLEGALERVQLACGPYAQITSEVVRGHVASVLLEGDQDDDIVVVARPERRARAVLPDWAAPVRIASAATGPVVVVPASGADSGRDISAPAVVTVGIDDPEWAAALLEHAFGLASPLGASVRILHVEPVRAGATTDRIEEGRLRRWLRHEVERAAASSPTVAWQLDIVDGAPGPLLEQASCESTLLIVGRHATPRAEAHRLAHAPHRLGTVARHLLRCGVCPVVFIDAEPQVRSAPAASHRANAHG